MNGAWPSCWTAALSAHGAARRGAARRAAASADGRGSSPAARTLLTSSLEREPRANSSVYSMRAHTASNCSSGAAARSRWFSSASVLPPLSVSPPFSGVESHFCRLTNDLAVSDAAALRITKTMSGNWPMPALLCQFRSAPRVRGRSAWAERAWVGGAETARR